MVQPKDIGNEIEKKVEQKLSMFENLGTEKNYTTGREDKIQEVWLHAKKYKLFETEYEVEDPYWAEKDFEFEFLS